MSLFEIVIIVLLLLLIFSIFSVAQALRTQVKHFELLQRTLMNFEKIVFDDNFEILAELRHMNDDDGVFDKDHLRQVRNRTIKRE
jgi:hypothetical protein